MWDGWTDRQADTTLSHLLYKQCTFSETVLLKCNNQACHTYTFYKQTKQNSHTAGANASFYTTFRHFPSHRLGLAFFRYTLNIREKHCNSSKPRHVCNNTALTLTYCDCKGCQYFLYHTASCISWAVQHQYLLQRYLP